MNVYNRLYIEELKERIECLEERLTQWVEYYEDGLPADEVYDMYHETLELLE